MKTIQLKEIQIGKNVRTDYGDLHELAASIKTNGIRHPVELDKDHNLVDGFRRLGAVAMINKEGIQKIEDIPYFINDRPIDRVEEQLISGIFQKNLTPVEEATAYNEYLKTTKRSTDTLAKKLGKTKAYIERRLVLLKLSPDTLKALNKNQIEIGHANLLAQMTPQQQKVALKEIIDYDLTVQNFSDQIRWMQKIDFGELPFREGERFHKSQTTLHQIGSELNPLQDQRILRDEKAFRKDIAQYVESQRKILKEKGITVFASSDALLKKHPKAMKLSEYDYKLNYDYAKIVRQLPKKADEFGVVVDYNFCLEKTIFALDGDTFLQQLKEKQKEKTPSEKPTEVEQQEADQMLELSREEKLKNKVEKFKTTLLQTTTTNLIKTRTKESKALILYALFDSLGWNDKEVASKTLKVGAPQATDTFFKKLLKKDTKALDDDIHTLALFWVQSLYGKKLEDLAVSCGLDYKSHFEMSEDFLKLFQKSQLIDLAGELSVNVTGLVKNKDITEAILKENTTGKVPAILCAA